VALDLAEGAATIVAIVNEQVVEERREESAHAFVLMMLVAIELWCRLFLDAAVSSAPAAAAAEATLAEYATRDRR